MPYFYWFCQKLRKRKKLVSIGMLSVIAVFILLSFIMGDGIPILDDEDAEEAESSMEETTEREKTWRDEDFVFYFQDHDQPWSAYPHGSSTVAKSGCGTVSLAMCLVTLTGDEDAYNPGKLAEYMEEHDMETPNQDVDCIPKLCEAMNTGCHADTYYGDLDFEIVDETLKKGGFIILDQEAETGNELNNQVFSRINHYIVIRRGRQKKGYYIASSLYGYSSEDSNVAYAPQNGTKFSKEMFQARYYYAILKD